jgi:hypothetical protein
MYTGPNIITTGLVYGYDTGIGTSTNNVATRLYPGDPTTNAIPNASTFNGGWGAYTNSNDGTFITEFGTTGYQILNRLSWNGIYQNFNLGSSGNYTFSAWFKYLGGAANNNGATVYISNYGGGDTATALNKSLVGVWQRVSTTVNVTSPGNVYFYIISYGGGGDDRSTWQVTMPQAELGTILTPFVNGTRSTTQALIDVKRARTIDLSTVSFNNSAQPIFDGTDDEINTGITDQLTDFSCVVVFKNNNSEAWGRIVDKSYSDGFFISSYFATSGAGYVGAGIIEPNPPHGQAFQYDTSKYNYFAVTRSGSTHTVYLNGSGTSLSKTGSSSALSAVEMAIGAWYGSTSSQRFTGEIPVVKLYNRALTANEIQQDFNAYRSRFGI